MPPVADDATVNLTAGQSTMVVLPSTDETALAGCTAGTPSDPRLTVSIPAGSCQATISDSGTTSDTATFVYTATETCGNTDTATVTVNIIGQVFDGLLDVIVDGPTRIAAGDKSVVAR